MAVIETKTRTDLEQNGSIILYENKLTSVTISGAEATLVPNTWERYELAAGTVAPIYSLSSPSKVNCVGIAAHNLGSKNATIKVWVKNSGGVFASSPDAAIAPRDNEPLLFLFDSYDNADSVKIEVSNGTNREIGVVYAGEYLQMQRPIYGGHSPINLADRTEYKNAISVTGNFLGRKVIRQGAQTTFNWKNLDPDWYREKFVPFVESAKTKPFFIKWRPDYYPEETAFGFTTGDIIPQNMPGGVPLISVSLTMRAHK